MTDKDYLIQSFGEAFHDALDARYDYLISLEPDSPFFQEVPIRITEVSLIRNIFNQILERDTDATE